MGNLSLTKVLNPQPGWYRGDFHLHTTFSDGIYPPLGLAQLAKTEGLDFVAITDHNAIGSFSEFDDDPGMLIIPGIEVTLTEGHWNAFGIEGWQDWMEKICVGQICVSLRGTGLTTTKLLRQLSQLGLLNSIDHPLLKPWEWRDGSTVVRYFDCVEIWNDPLWPDNAQANPQAVTLWTDWLNAGYRITAIGGSDFHFLPGEVEGFPGERPGLPMTYVYAQELSSAAILEGLRQHQVYVSLGPKITFLAYANGKTYGIGEDLGITSDKIRLTGSVSEGQGAAYLRLVKNGEVIAKSEVKDDEAQLEFGEQADPNRQDWYRLEVVSQTDQVVAITNPVYVGTRREPELGRFEDFLSLPQSETWITSDDVM